ncbi:MAG: methyltransferase domain-containing protein [Desulfomonile tiedjei]|nr:methyltransferase domain-containing protein [Desulfomonile tiedjei]
MRQFLLQLLRCPQCRGTLEATAFERSSGGEEIVEGVLVCGCGASYPIANTIPRVLENAYELFPDFAERYRERLPANRRPPASGKARGWFESSVVRTQRSFGYQWTTFSEMVCDFRDNFWNYLHPATPETFKGRLGLDAGCGFGRHIYHAAACGAEMVGVDLSRAIDATHKNTRQFPNVHLVQANIYALPFEPGTFDFVYSIGVLHHLPDPGRGINALAGLVKPNGSMFVWLYSSTRRITNFFLEAVRHLTTRLPYSIVNGMSFAGALVDQVFFVLPYRAVRRIPGVGGIAEKLAPPRIKMYSRYPFQVLHADWFDRLAAPVRFYYSEAQVREALEMAGLGEIQTSPTGYYGWRGCGVRQGCAANSAEEKAPAR